MSFWNFWPLGPPSLPPAPPRDASLPTTTIKTLKFVQRSSSSTFENKPIASSSPSPSFPSSSLSSSLSSSFNGVAVFSVHFSRLIREKAAVQAAFPDLVQIFFVQTGQEKQQQQDKQQQQQQENPTTRAEQDWYFLNLHYNRWTESVEALKGEKIDTQWVAEQIRRFDAQPSDALSLLSPLGPCLELPMPDFFQLEHFQVAEPTTTDRVHLREF